MTTLIEEIKLTLLLNILIFGHGDFLLCDLQPFPKQVTHFINLCDRIVIFYPIQLIFSENENREKVGKRHIMFAEIKEEDNNENEG